jgi:hypothetical protein
MVITVNAGYLNVFIFCCWLGGCGEGQSNSELLYDWRFTANQFILAPSPLRITTSNFFLTEPLRSQFLCNVLSGKRMGLSFTTAAGRRQCSHSRIRVPRDSWPYFTNSDPKLHEPGEPGPCIFILQEEEGPVLPPGTGFRFRRLLRLAGLRWSYCNPPPHGLGLTSKHLVLRLRF